MLKYIGLGKQKDEREQYIFYHTLSQLFLFNYIFLLIILFATLTINIVKDTFTIESLLILITVLISSLSLLIGMNKTKIDTFTVSSHEMYIWKRRKLRFLSFVSGIIFFVLSFILDCLHSIIVNDNIISFTNFIIWIVSSTIFGLGLYIFLIKKLKIDIED
ncbi:hypothetical protein [Staphylococcus hominis]|uniref:hypothetical protein n=1 Tax=Staphylococcus hominis TaxID=1290 RepID=UPI000C7C5E1D|nr:hypothetical protein [Staphylococcus hominis]MCI2921922.1 hypothetical protein [Staphylococcus hominis]MDS3888285.1 hypothetical protein [Staphylococcus hominis]MDS3899178.1 hypothetical protein [Staphylococcus hominis]MDS3916588.1 hypothetical protein [Staphylococcus hominis]PLA22444.1 hypothetical protein CYK06_10930 [Staphylococcus hominis]